MNPSPLSALATAVQAQIAAAIDRDLAMMLESGLPGAVAKTAATAGATATTAQSATVPLAEAQPAGSLQPPPAPSPSQVVDTARATAAGRQASMAPLFADLAQALANPELPAPIKAVVRQILTFQTPLDTAPSGQTIARAVAQSGLFLEAHLAASGDNPPAPDLKAALLTLRQALATPGATSAPTPRAPTSPTPTASSPAQPTTAPDPAIATPDAARVSPAEPPTAAGAPSAPDAPAPTAPVLIRGLDQALARASSVAPLADELARALESPSLPAPVKTAIAQVLAQQVATRGALADDTEGPPPPDLKAALLTLRQALASPDTERATSPPPRTMAAAPPSRDAATAAQPPARASLPDHADLGALTEALARGVDQAVARQSLHQLASLPNGPDQAWMFELPLATPQGAAVAQFKIDRDGSGAAGHDGAPGWRVRFSIDVEPLGPLHVHLNTGRGRASVNVWAERPASLVPLRDLGGELARALQADVRFMAGAPSHPVPQPGRFLDAST